MKNTGGNQQVLSIITRASPPSQQDQDESDVFIAPMGKKNKGKKDLGKFFEQNQYVYKP